MRDIYLAENRDDAALLIDKAIAGCVNDNVDEIVSLGNTLRSWRNEILAHQDTGASNGPTEGLNLCVKKVMRGGHGFRSFENYRRRVHSAPAVSPGQRVPDHPASTRSSPPNAYKPRYWATVRRSWAS